MPPIPKAKRILGIDPGTQVLGYAVIECVGRNIEVLTMGVLKLDALADHPEKLQKIFERVQEVIRRYSPSEMAIESPFYAKNAQSMFKLGRAQGVAIAAAMTLDVSAFEYAPRKIKQSVTGRGNATKEQVQAMLENIIKKELDVLYFDASDALATAICHSYQFVLESGGTPKKPAATKRKSSSWSSFVQQNPDKVKK